MTQEQKQLLLKDLCARLPYGVYVDIYSWQKDSPKLLFECIPEYVGEEIVVKNIVGRHPIKEVKPYLRPMSSMTEEEIGEYRNLSDEVIGSYGPYHHEFIVHCVRLGIKPDNPHECVDNFLNMEAIDWLNAHQFDYRIDPSTGKTLIESGLALEAPEGMYKNL